MNNLNTNSLGEVDSAMTPLLMSGDILSQDIFSATPNDQYPISIKLLDVPSRARLIASFDSPTVPAETGF